MNWPGFARVVSRVPPALRESWMAVGLHWQLAGVVLAALAFALLGPFGTWDRYPLAPRLAYWGLGIGANWLFALTVIPAAIRVCDRLGIPDGVGVAAGSVLAALPGTGAIAFLNGLFGTFHTSPGALGILYLQVLLVHAVLASVAHAFIIRPLRRRPTATDDPVALAPAAETPPPAAPPPAEDSPLLAALPRRLGREVIRLRMQDHYVEVHTPLGHELVLMRFRDALQEVAGMDGMQVHRSHWVARRAVATVRQHQGRTELRLRDGALVPVSRSFLPALRSAGWLDAAQPPGAP